MHFKLIAPASGEFWKPTMTAGVLVTPQNEGYEHDHLVSRLDELQAEGHTYEVVDSEALATAERSRIYMEEAYGAVATAGSRYSIRQVFGSRKHSGADDFGTKIPALIIFDAGKAVDVYPHRITDGTFRTIRGYVDAL